MFKWQEQYLTSEISIISREHQIHIFERVIFILLYRQLIYVIEIVNLALILISSINRQPFLEGCRIEGKVSLLVDRLFLTAIKLSKGLNTAADVFVKRPSFRFSLLLELVFGSLFSFKASISSNYI